MPLLKTHKFTTARAALHFKEALRRSGIRYVYWCDGDVHHVALLGLL